MGYCVEGIARASIGASGHFGICLARQNIIMLRVTTSEQLPAEGVFEEAKPAAVKGFSRKGLHDKENINMMQTGFVTIFYLRDPAINCCCRRELPPLDSNTLLWRRIPLT